MRYIGTKGTKLGAGIPINEVNIFENGILEAYKITQAGGNASLFDRMLSGLNWAIFRDGKTAEVWLERVRGGNGERVMLKDAQYRFPAMSPNQKWIAYVSDESGKDEIYVAPLPPSSQAQGKRKVSSDGGVRVHWRRDGKELIYMTAMGAIMSVEINDGAVFQASPPHVLFRAEGDPAGWDVSADGQRFLGTAQ